MSHPPEELVKKKPVPKKKGLAKKPSHPGGNPGAIEGVMMLKSRKPR